MSPNPWLRLLASSSPRDCIRLLLTARDRITTGAPAGHVAQAAFHLLTDSSIPAIRRPSAKMKSEPFQLSPLLVLTLTLALAFTLAATLIPRLIALLVLFLNDGVTWLVTIALLIKFTLLLHLPGILIP